MIRPRSRSARRFDPRALPIAVKLAVLLAVVLVFTGIVTDRVVNQVVQTSQEQVAMQDLEALSRSQALRVVDVLEQEITALQSLGGNSLVQDQLGQANDEEISPTDTTPANSPIIELGTQVQAFRQTHREFSTIALADARGRIRGMDPFPLTPIEAAPGSWEWFQATYNNGQGAIYAANSSIDSLINVEGIHIAIPVYRVAAAAEDRAVIGVIYAVWNASNLGVSDIGGGREALVMTSDGVTIFPMEKWNTSYPAGILNQVSSVPTGASVYVDSDGQDWLYGYTNLSELALGEDAISGLNWTVMVRRPSAAVAETTRFMTANIRLAIGASALFVTLVVGIFMTMLLQPLRRLTEAATSLERGQLEAPLPDLPADEVGRLAQIMRSLVDRLVKRFGELRAAVQVSHTAMLTLDQSQMLNDVARALTTQFSYPEVRIYATDASGTRAAIQAGSGSESERLLRSGHRLPVDETTVVGTAILMAESQLDKTGTNVAIPLQSGGRVQGAIELTSRPSSVFEPEDIDLLRLIADQLAASIENARLFQQSAENLAEIEALNRRLTRQAWEEYVGTGGAIRHTLDPEQNYPDALALLGERTDLRAQSYEDENGRSVLVVPLVLRGQAVGTIAVTRPAGEHWSRDEEALLESIAARMAVIAEGIRLVDESTRRAVREQRVNEVSATLLQRATDVESVLRTALNELGGALGSDRISLRIGPAPVDGERQKSNVSARDGDKGASSNGDGGLTNV